MFDLLITFIAFAFILGLLIFIHELGHFLTAKRSGIKVEEFAFGFPPRLFAIKKGDTEYALNLLPFGGYVKMLGEDDDATVSEKKSSRSFAHQDGWIRARVVVAGVVMNILFAWVLMSLGFMIGTTPPVSKPEAIPHAKISSKTIVTMIKAGSAAEKAGLKTADQITTLNDQSITTAQQAADYVKSQPGKPITMTIVRNGQELKLSGQLGEVVSPTEGPLGAGLADDQKVRLPIWWAPIYAVWETLKAFGMIFVGILGFFKQLFAARQIPAEAAGPVGIFYLTGDIIHLGLAAVLNFMTILSLNLAAINILPIPALDGGRLLFILLEKLNRGKKVLNQQIENWAHMIGFALLIILILVITYHDILRLGK